MDNVWWRTSTAILCTNQIKGHNGVLGNDAMSFPYYDRLHEILGTRATSSPPVLVESGECSNAAPSDGQSIVNGRLSVQTLPIMFA